MAHRAGQSTRQVSFPPPAIGSSPDPPHAHWKETVSFATEKAVTEVCVMRPHDGQRGLNGDQAGSFFFPVSSSMIWAIRSRPESAKPMTRFMRPEAYMSSARSSSTSTRRARRDSRNGARKCSE
jgi:hypothetical protein